MKCVVTNRYGVSETVDVLFSFEIKGNNYMVFRKNDELLCRKIKCSLFTGIKIIGVSVCDEILGYANTILENNDSNSKFYSLKGEHYVITLCNSSGRINFQKRKCKLYHLSKLSMETFIKWIFSMVCSLSYAFVYTNTKGLMWAYCLFPNAERKVLIVFMYLFQILATSLIFTFKKEKRSLFDFFINALIPLNIITLFGVMKSNIVIKIIILVCFGIATIFYSIPKLKSTLVSKKKAKRKKEFKNFLSRAYVSLLVCIAIGSIGANFFGITGYTSKGTVASLMAEDVQVKQDYEQSLKNINENVWKELSEQEKIDILQDICDYECINQFGCDSVTVQTGYPTSACVYGSYNHFTKIITINSEFLKEEHVSDVLDILLHEIRHVWQNTIADMYGDVESDLDDKYKNISIFKQAREFRYSFDTYQSGNFDYDSYYEQLVETDSRAWAESIYSYSYDKFVFAEKYVEEEKTKEIK